MRPAPSMPGGGDLAVDTSAAVVEAVVVSYNTRPQLERCLGELGAQGQHVIVVDCASSDSSVELVRERFPHVEVLALRDNRGFGAAANQGIARVESRYALLLNADAWPLAGAVRELVLAAAGDPRAAIVAPCLLNLDGSPQRSVFGYPESPLALALWVAFPSAVSTVFQAWRNVQSVPIRILEKSRSAAAFGRVADGDFPAGAALLVLKGAFEEAGGFDEAFFMYGEETDLCRRLRQRGWRIALCPAAAFVHVGGASTAQARRAMYQEQLRSHLRFIAKHRGNGRGNRARRLLAAMLRLRSLVSRGEARQRRHETAGWLSSTDLETLLR